MTQQMYSLYLEYSILHSILNNGTQSMEEALTILKNSEFHFYNELHRKLFNLMSSMYAKGKDINQITVFENAKLILPYDTLKITFQKIANGEIIENVKDACMKLIDYSVKRKLYAYADSVQHEHGKTGMDILSTMNSKLQELTMAYMPSGATKVCEFKSDAMYVVDEAMRFRALGEFPGVPTGFMELDKMMGGMKGGQLITIAARPAMGKTSFALSTALNGSKRYPSVIFSLEMDKVTLLLRLASQYSRVPLTDVLNGSCTKEQRDKIEHSIDMINQNYNIIIDDDGHLDATILKAKIRRYVQEFNAKSVFIDYLQLMKTNIASNREREVAMLTQSLKETAREFKVPIVILAQLNREVEHRTNKIPMLSDLRESGAIEQDSDVVMFLHRPEYYGVKTYENGDPTCDTCDVIIAKQRNGAIGEVRLTYVKEYTGFYNYIAPGILPATNHEPFEEKYDEVPF